MLTEADMIRILAEKYRLTESVVGDGIDYEARSLFDAEDSSEMQDHDPVFHEAGN